jgi:(2Fe-2S) ferredoxin
MEPRPPPYERVILVCTNVREPGRDACGNRGSEKLLEWIKDRAKATGAKKRLRVTRSGCLDMCAHGPNVAVLPEQCWMNGVAESDLESIAVRWIDPLGVAGAAPRAPGAGPSPDPSKR